MKTTLKSFNGGVISKKGIYRNDVKKVTMGAGKMVNFTVDVIGAVKKRNGFRFVHKATSNENVKLIPFRVASGLSYVLEFTALKITIYNELSKVTTVSSTYKSDEVMDLKVAQFKNALYIVHPKHPLSKLIRFPTGWSFIQVSETHADWSSVKGYPSVICFHENRLWLGATETDNQKLWVSATNDYEDFASGENEDDAFDRTVSASRLNSIVWLHSGRELAMGTLSDEFLITGSDTKKGISNTNIQIKSQTTIGSKRISPVRVDKSLMFVQLSGLNLRNFQYSFTEDSYSAAIENILTDAIKGSVVDMVYQQDPDTIIWMATEQGELVGLTINEAQNINGFHNHDVGGKVSSLCIIPSQSDAKEEVYAVVERDGVKNIEMMVDSDECFMDSWFKYKGDKTSVIAGLDHLNDTIVSVVADGFVHPNIDVIDNKINLKDMASEVYVGYPVVSEMVTIPLDKIGNVSFPQIKVKITDVAIGLVDTFVGIEYGVGNINETLFRNVDSSLAGGAVKFNGYTNPLVVAGTYGENTEVTLRHKYPLNCIISALAIDLKVTGT